ncbi:hypothetical protein HAX54_036417 [Datura stramonium]|uniref:Uncharacterized protein n=1 Tax=Datura stramonium TaxID=4076 RepID=A0ABS8VI47_DATST|nr:hypothetical protein [Datura stramonium]
MSGTSRLWCPDLEKFDEYLGEIEEAACPRLNFRRNLSKTYPYYDPPVVFDAYKNNEEEEHHAQMSDMEKMILEHMEVMREQLTAQGKSLKGTNAKLTEMMADAAPCNDL